MEKLTFVVKNSLNGKKTNRKTILLFFKQLRTLRTTQK